MQTWALSYCVIGVVVAMSNSDAELVSERWAGGSGLDLSALSCGVSAGRAQVRGKAGFCFGGRTGFGVRVQYIATARRKAAQVVGLARPFPAGGYAWRPRGYLTLTLTSIIYCDIL